MILKSYLVEKDITILDKYFITLIYGENIGMKDDIKNLREDMSEMKTLLTKIADGW